MTKRKWHAKGWPATPMLAALISLGVPAVIHGASVQSQNTQSAHDSDITRQELACLISSLTLTARLPNKSDKIPLS